MREFFGRFVVGSLPGIVAAALAIAITWVFFERFDEESKKPCASNPCFIELDTRTKLLESRLSKIEASQHPSTSKRFTSSDAAAMELRLIKCHNLEDPAKCLLEERLQYERSKK